MEQIRVNFFLGKLDGHLEILNPLEKEIVVEVAEIFRKVFVSQKKINEINDLKNYAKQNPDILPPRLIRFDPG